MNRRWICIALVAMVASACKKDEPKSTRWDDASVTIAIAPSSSAPVLPTGTFNKFFPKDVVFSADKESYAEAKVQKDGKEVAQLSISDTERLATAKDKFAAATEKLEGYPVVQVGKNQSTVLVKDRFQVKVASPTLDHDARKAILATFDLKGLATL